MPLLNSIVPSHLGNPLVVLPQNLPPPPIQLFVPMNNQNLPRSAVAQEIENMPPRVPISNTSFNSEESPERHKLVVLDTNIFMHYIDDAWKIIRSKNFKLVILWNVHQELDRLKNDRNKETAKLARDAQKKVTLILEKFSHKVYRQSVYEYNRAKKIFPAENDDDFFLQAVLQLQNARKELVYLHTNDVGLKNKALHSGMRVFQMDRLLLQ